MLTTNDVTRIYDTIMSIPGMNETVKIDSRISRKNALILDEVIKRGLALETDDKSSELLSRIPKETTQELTVFADECLVKAGLKELSEKLTSHLTIQY